MKVSNDKKVDTDKRHDKTYLPLQLSHMSRKLLVWDITSFLGECRELNKGIIHQCVFLHATTNLFHVVCQNGILCEYISLELCEFIAGVVYLWLRHERST